QKPTKRELILLQKIKQLEEQLNQTTTERDNLKQLLQQEKQRADNAEQQLREMRQHLEPETQSQIIQSPPTKLKISKYG
ncbi:13_t:CDS:1, partial [Paraglomus brasilianum]